MTVLLLILPPALRNVSPNTARKMMGAIILLKPKKYCTFDEVSSGTYQGYLGDSCTVIPWCRGCIGMGVEARSRVRNRTFLPW
jgi:hypothetical protein